MNILDSSFFVMMPIC